MNVIKFAIRTLRMKFKNLFEEGTVAADIAPVETKLGQTVRREEELEEGFVHPDYIEENVSIAFYNDHKSQESFASCFDVDALKIAIINAYAKRANYSKSMSGLEVFDMNIFEEDATTDEIAFWLNVHCKHHHTWIFKGFAQHNTQVIFGTKTGKRTVVVYQHFPRTIKESVMR